MYCPECGQELELDKEAKSGDATYRFYKKCPKCELGWDFKLRADGRRVIWAVGYQKDIWRGS